MRPNPITLVRIVGIFVAATLIPFGWAQDYPADIQALLDRPERPRMAEVLSLLKSRRRNPFPKPPNAMDSESFKANILLAAPRIALLESLFPGLVLAPLGRDAILFGDIFDAFYLTHGITGRMVPIGISSPTLASPATNFYLSDYLAQLGAPLVGQRRPPFILFDRTSFAETSQSTRLVQTIVDRFIAEGGVPEDLAARLAVFTTDDGLRAPENADARHEYFHKTRVHLQSRHILPGALSFGSGLRARLGNGGPGLTDSLPWHDRFGPLVRAKGSNRVLATPGTPILAHREAILFDMVRILRIVSSDHFLKSVQKAATQLGTPFEIVGPRELSAAEPPRSATWANVSKEFRQWIDGIPHTDAPDRETSQELTRSLLGWWQKHARGPTEGRALKAVIFGTQELRQRNILRGRDARTLVERVLTELDLNEPTESALLAVGRASEYFRKIVSRFPARAQTKSPQQERARMVLRLLKADRKCNAHLEAES